MLLLKKGKVHVKVKLDKWHDFTKRWASIPQLNEMKPPISTWIHGHNDK